MYTLDVNNMDINKQMNSVTTSEGTGQFIIQTIKSKIHCESTHHCLYFWTMVRLHINACVYKYISVNITTATTITYGHIPYTLNISAQATFQETLKNIKPLPDQMSSLDY